MIELSNERVEQILHKETQKTEELATILRGVYTRYMRLYEKYFADIEALNDGEIADLKRYHEETGSLMKYYYMDIPKDVCTELKDFDEKYTAKLLGADWHNCLFDSYEAFRVENEDAYPSEKQMKALHDLNLTGNISYSGQGQELINLYNDLKKLREK